MNWWTAAYVGAGVFGGLVAFVVLIIAFLWANSTFGGGLWAPFVSVGKGLWWCIRNILKFVAIMLLGFLALIAAILGLLIIVGYVGVVGLRKVIKAALPGLRFLLRSHENVGLVFLWPLIAYNIAHIFLGYGSSRRAWQEALQDPWQLGGVVFGSLVLTIFIAAIVKNGTLRASPTYQKYAWRVMLAIVILMILVPWLWQLADNQIHSQPEPRAAIQTTTTNEKERVQKTEKGSGAYDYDTDPFFNPPDAIQSRVWVDIGPLWRLNSEPSILVAVGGREESGFEAFLLTPGQKVSLAYRDGQITTWSRVSRQNISQSIYGNPAGYVQKNLATGDVWDWSGNFRYAKESGVMPGETLVILGKVGSGEEKVFQFPDGATEITIVNDKQTPQTLVFYYHAMTNFYVGNGGACANASGTPLVYPDKEAAYACRDFGAESVSGWKDQGLAGEQITLAIKIEK